MGKGRLKFGDRIDMDKFDKDGYYLIVFEDENEKICFYDKKDKSVWFIGDELSYRPEIVLETHKALKFLDLYTLKYADLENYF